MKARWSVNGIHGSSPRTRGTDPQRLARLPEIRFIPAHAGNSSAAGELASEWTVHPRARGEQPFVV